MNYKNKHYLLLHLIILIWGFTGIIGKELSNSGMDSIPIVIIRMLIGWSTLLIYILYKRLSKY